MGHLLETVVSHLGGDNVLAAIGARQFVADDTCVSFRLGHANPKGVRSVVIATASDGFFSMQCYGERSPGSLTPPLVGMAQEIIPENLATVLGKLTGIEGIHHRHF
jgi:hypothetical protein